MILCERRSRTQHVAWRTPRRGSAVLALAFAALILGSLGALGTNGVGADGFRSAPPCPGDPPPPACAPDLPCLPDAGGGFCNENPEECDDGSSPSGNYRRRIGTVSLFLMGIANLPRAHIGLSARHPCPGDPPPGGTDPGPTPVPLTPVCAECEAPGVAASVETPEVQVQTNPETGLVNLPTWLWAEGYRGQDLFATRSWSPPYEPTTIEVRYSVRRYLWNFGDGGQIESKSLGQPYPQESDIMNAYGWSSRTEPGGVFHLALIIEWNVEYRVNGGPPTPLPPFQRRYEAIHPVQELQPIITNP